MKCKRCNTLFDLKNVRDWFFINSQKSWQHYEVRPDKVCHWRHKIWIQLNCEVITKRQDSWSSWSTLWHIFFFFRRERHEMNNLFPVQLYCRNIFFFLFSFPKNCKNYNYFLLSVLIIKKKIREIYITHYTQAGLPTRMDDIQKRRAHRCLRWAAACSMKAFKAKKLKGNRKNKIKSEK